MNLWLRLLVYLLGARWRPAVLLPDGVSTLDMRVLPNDLDPSLHMNNGRYLSLMDLGRLDFMVATGLWRVVLRNRWTPIASLVAIRFRRELRAFAPFRLETRLLAWDATTVVMEQVFRRKGGPGDGEIAARALFRGGLYDRRAGAFLSTARLMQELGIAAESPAPSEEVRALLATDDALRRGR
jgi:acyl-CoA thioesterase FadM